MAGLMCACLPCTRASVCQACLQHLSEWCTGATLSTPMLAHNTACWPHAEGCHVGAGWCPRHAGTGGRQAQAPPQGGHHHPELCTYAPPQEPLPGAACCSADHPVSLQGQGCSDTGHGDKVGTPAATCLTSVPLADTWRPCTLAPSSLHSMLHAVTHCGHAVIHCGPGGQGGHPGRRLCLSQPASEQAWL